MPGRADDASALAVFAYGTLKHGFRNHAAYCAGVREVHPAVVTGRLHVWQPGIPILEVPESSILLMGSSDPARDLQAAGAVGPDDLGRAHGGPGLRWRRIQGELLVFTEGLERLRILDAFEGVHPSPRERPYERVLLPVQVQASAWGDRHLRAGWAYVQPPQQPAQGEALDTDLWEPGRL